jgi:hypothetical protein
MKISRTNLGFMSVLAAGLLLAVAAFALPSATTFGSETDQAPAVDTGDLEALLAANYAANNAPAAPSTQAPAPPAAPLDMNSADNGANGNVPILLPSTGSGGLSGSTSTNYGFLLIGLGVALMGSGSLVWAASRKRR